MMRRGGKTWPWIGLGALFALQIYFVRELLAALLLFALFYAVVASVVVVLFVFFDTAGRGMVRAESLWHHVTSVFQVWITPSQISGKAAELPAGAVNPSLRAIETKPAPTLRV